MTCAWRKKSTNSPYMQHYKPVSQVHMSMVAHDFTFFPTIVKCSVAVWPRLVHVKHQVSIVLILLHFILVPWPPGNNVCSLYQILSLQLAFPPHNSYILCISDKTLITVMHKHNIRTALLPLLAWGFPGFSMSLPAFSSNPSNGSSRYPCVRDCPSTVVSVVSLSHVSIMFATISIPLGWNVLCCGGDNVFYTLHEHKFNTNTPKYTLTH